MTGTDAETESGDLGSALILRPWTGSDVSGLREAIDEDLGHLKPWLGWTREEPSSLEETGARIASWVRQFREGRGFRYAIVAGSSPSRILGGAGLNHRIGPAAYTVGYWVRRSAARQGIASAAVSALVVRAFDDLSSDRLVIECDIANVASASFARGLGFEPVGTATTAYRDGAPRPVHRFALGREAYGRRHRTAFHRRARGVRVASRTPEPPTGAV
jgi:ribosomal-protein-serine acetyltransferase